MQMSYLLAKLLTLRLSSPIELTRVWAALYTLLALVPGGREAVAELR